MRLCRAWFVLINALSSYGACSIVFSCSTSLAVAQLNPSVAAVVRRYEDCVSKIRTLDVHLETCTSSETSLYSTCSRLHWTYDSSVGVRFTLQAENLVNKKERYRHYLDFLVLEDKYYSCNGVELSGHASGQSRALQYRGHIGPITDSLVREKLHRGYASMMDLLISRIVTKEESVCEPRRSIGEVLRDSAQKFGPDAVQLSQEMVQGAPCWKIGYRHPGGIVLGRIGMQDMRISFYFDPAANYSIRKEVRQGKSFPDEIYESSTVSEVTKFRDCGDGIFFPEEITSVSEYGPSRRTTTARVTSVSINQPIPEDRWNFRFPEGILVYEYSSFPEEGVVRKDTSQDRIHVVGAGGAFVRSFRPGSAEHEEYRREILKSFQLRATGQRTRLAVSAAGVLLLVLVCGAVWNVRRRRLAKLRPGSR